MELIFFALAISLLLALIVGAVQIVRWILKGLARLFGLSDEPSPSFGRCPVCRAQVGSFRDCDVCGWTPHGIGDEAARRIALVQLRQLVRRGLVDEPAFRQLEAHFASLSPPPDRAAAGETERPMATARRAPASSGTGPAAVPSEAIIQAELVRAEPVPPADERLPGSDVPAEPIGPERIRPGTAPSQPAQPPRSPAPPPARPAAPAAQRVRRFVEGQRQAAEEAAQAQAAPKPPSPPRRAVGEILAAFMEEKHIRWGELVGGLLIVSCSAALVISFWSTIAERPWLQFGVFNGVTAALFGIGLHAARRWRLPTTSQGVLLIAMLLVPLNFLAIAAFSEGAAPANLLALTGEIVSIAAFTALAYFAAKILVPQATLPLVLVVIAQSILELLMRRLVGPESGLSVLYLVSLLSLGIYAGVNLWGQWQLVGTEPISESRANEIFKLLGVSSFATLLAVGLMVFKVGDVPLIRQLAPLAALAAIPALSLGVTLWRRVEPALGGIQTAGISIAVGGVVILLAGLSLAWPQPCTLLPAAALTGVILILLATWHSIPETHLVAAFCLLIAYTLSFHVLTGKLAWQVDGSREVISAALSVVTGNALIGLVGLMGLVTGGWAWWGRRQDALFWGCAAGGVALLSLALIVFYGFGSAGDPHGATWSLALYTLLFFATAVGLRQVAVTWLTVALALLTCIQAVVYRYGEFFGWQDPWTVAYLAHATLMTLSAICGRLGWPQLFPLDSLPAEADGAKHQSPAAWDAASLWKTDPWSAACLLISIGAVAWLPLRAMGSGAAIPATFITWAGVLWLVIAWLQRTPYLYAAFQAAMTVALVLAVDQRLRTREWYSAVETGWCHPWALQAVGIALALLGMVWIAVRWLVRPARVESPRVESQAASEASWRGTARQLLLPAWPTVDRYVTVAVVVLLACLAVYAVVPGIAQELSPQTTAQVRSATRLVPPASDFQLAGLPHGPAKGRGCWLLWTAVLGLLATGLVERRNWWQAAGLAISLSAAALLLAARFEPQVAVASAARWFTAALFGLGSVAIWMRSTLGPWLRPLGRAHRRVGRQAIYHTMVLLLVVTVLPLVAMATFVGLAAVRISPPTSDQVGLLQVLMTIFVAAALLALISRWLANDKSPLPQPVAGTQSLMRHGGNTLLVLGVAPLLVMTLFVVAVALGQHPIVGPEPTSFFVRLGLAGSYAIPLFVFALALIGHAIDQRSASLTLAAGWLLNFCVTAAYLLTVKGQGLLDYTQWLRLAQLNAIVASAYALAWMGYAGWALRWPRAFSRRLTLLPTQLGVAGGLSVLAILPAVGGLFLAPDGTFPFENVAGLWGWTALVLILAAVVTHAWLERRDLAAGTLAVGLFGVGCLAAFETHRWDLGTWLTYHAAQVGQLATGLALVATGWLWPKLAEFLGVRGASWQRSASRWVTVLLPVEILFAMRGTGNDPQSPWWTVAGLLGATALSATLAAWRGQRRFLYLAGALLNLAASIWWIEEGRQLIATRSIAEIWHFVYVNVIALSLPVPFWFWIERRYVPPGLHRAAILRLGFHRLAATIAVTLLSIFVGLSLLADFVGGRIHPQIGFGWLAWATIVVAVITCLWDVRARFAVAGLYFCGLIAATMFVDQFDLQPEQLMWTASLVLGAYGVGTSYLWSRRQGLGGLAKALRIPDRGEERSGLLWLVPANLLLAALVVLLGYWAQFAVEDAALRLSASQAVIAQAFSIGMLARGRRETALRFMALWLGVAGAVAFGWSFLTPGSDGILLNRCVAVAVSLAGMAVLYGLGLSKLLRRENDWTRAAQRLVPALAGLTLAAVASVLGLEVVLYLEYEIARMSWPAIAAVALALVGLAAACLVAAVVPGRDPLGLSESHRTAYVYAAEAMLALLFLHVRLTMPWLFSGFFTQYWPLIVMAIAFLGVGLSEWFQRSQRQVLAVPLERTGALLPMLPVMGYWIGPTQVHFSVLMLVTGIFYGGLSVLRRSFGFGILAALAVNGGLWYLLHQTEKLGLLEHPQLWLIPPALCVLAAAYLNRQRLSETQMTTVRYLTSTVIYTASTADIFLNGVAQAPWLPLVLAAISILGILAGIALRVRAFLFLGTSFLVLSLMTIIWYAAVDLHQTWLWFVTGIVMGVLIIAAFATVEKKRDDVLKLVERLRQWDA